MSGEHSQVASRHRSISLSRKVAWALAALFLVLVLVGALTYRSLLDSNRSMGEVVESTVPATAAGYELRIHIAEFSSKVLRYLEAPAAELRGDALRNLEQIDAQQQLYLNVVRTEQERDLGRRIGKLLIDYRLFGLRVMEAADRLHGEIGELAQALLEVANKMDAEVLSQVDASSARAMQKFNAARGIESRAVELGRAIRYYAQDASPTHRALVLNTAEAMDHELKLLHFLPLNARERQASDQCGQSWKALRPRLISAVELKDEADQLYRDFNARRSGIEKEVDAEDMRGGAALRLRAKLEALQENQAQLKLAIVLGLLLSLVGAVLAYVWITGAVRRAVTSLGAGVQAIASGQMHIRLTGSGDAEFDHVLESFNRMAGRLQETTVSKSQLEESEQRLEHAVRGSLAGIWDWNLLSDAYYVSPRFKEMFGFDAHVAGVREFFVSHIHPDDVDRVEAVRLAHFEKRGKFDVEYRIRREDGGYLWVRDIGQAKWDDHGQVLRFSGSISDIDAQKQAEARIEHMAYYDGLTELPGRALFNDRLRLALQEAAKIGRLVALLFIDLDRFKAINDTLGHAAGDALLQQVAQRLQSCVRRGDVVGRFSGDEFGAVLADIGRMDDAGPLVNQFLQAFAKPFNLMGQECFVTPSIGVALYPNDGAIEGELLRAADVAMYRSKEHGGNGYQFYTADMTTKAQDRMAFENALHHALERGEFLLHYQPVVSPLGQIHAVEALIRWQHPQMGLVPPGRFIAMAEETGRIEQIGEWVLRTACAQMRLWDEAGFGFLGLAVNLSPRQLRQKDLAETVRRILLEARLEPSRLELEITEGILAKDEASAAALRDISAVGVRLSIDDFGTGYSSLAYLKRFPIDTLKIDQSFVRGIPGDAEDSAVVVAIIAMARSLELRLVAEGVETAEQLGFLRGHSCDTIQGYYFSRPIPAPAMTALLKDGRLLGPGT